MLGASQEGTYEGLFKGAGPYLGLPTFFTTSGQCSKSINILGMKDLLFRMVAMPPPDMTDKRAVRDMSHQYSVQEIKLLIYVQYVSKVVLTCNTYVNTWANTYKYFHNTCRYCKSSSPVSIDKIPTGNQNTLHL